MDKYIDIKDNLLELVKKDSNITGVIVIGSTTREEIKADEYSDLDLFIITEKPEPWFSGEYPNQLGNVRVSFLEPTLGGGRERRLIYDFDKDVDMIILTKNQFIQCVEEGVASIVMNRGYKVLYDEGEYTNLLVKHINPSVSKPTITEEEYINITNDFYFHIIWATKKLLRGEKWSSIMCVNAYLKKYVLRMLELECYYIGNRDVWHDGRFIDTWADDYSISSLTNCFAEYNYDSISNAIMETYKLFNTLSFLVSGYFNYPYPEEAMQCAGEYLELHLKEKREN